MLDFGPSPAAVPGRTSSAPAGRSAQSPAPTSAPAGATAASPSFADAMAAVAAAIEGRTGAHAPDAGTASPDATGSSTPPVSPNVPANPSLLDAVQSGFPSGWAVPSKGAAGDAHAQGTGQDAPADHSADAKTDPATDVSAVAAIIAAAVPVVPPAPVAVPTGQAGDAPTGGASDAHDDTNATPSTRAIDAAVKATAATTARQTAGAPPAAADDDPSAKQHATESTPEAAGARAVTSTHTQTATVTPARPAASASVPDTTPAAPQTPSKTPARFADFVARAISSRPNATIADVIAAAAGHSDNSAGASDAADATSTPGTNAPTAPQRALADELRVRAATALNLVAANGDRATAAAGANAPAVGLDGASLRALAGADKNATPSNDAARANAAGLADVVQKAAAPGHDAGVSFGFENSFAGGQKGATLLAPAATTSFTTSLSSASETTLPGDTVNQIVQAIRLQWANGSVGEAKITLQPDQFGDVTVSVRVDRGQVVARVEADAPVVREWLQSNQATLRHGLAEQNLALDRLEVSEPRESRDAERRGQRDTPDQQQPQRRPRRAPLDDTFEVVA